MISILLEKLTGKDDLERVARKGDPARLNATLKTRPVFVPKRPRRALDAGSCSQEELMKLLEEDAKEMADGPFEPWVLEMEGKRRLPVFSSPKKLESFAALMAKDAKTIFSVGYVQMLLADVTSQCELDFVDLNLFCERSWEIGVNGRSEKESSP